MLQNQTMNNEEKLGRLLAMAKTQLVKQAECQLTKLIKQDNSTLINLINIVQDPQCQKQSKVIALSLLSQVICNKIIGDIPIQKSCQLLINILLNRNIDFSYKKIMQPSIFYIFDNSSQPTITQFRQLIFQLMKQPQLRNIAYFLITCFCTSNAIEIYQIIYLTRIFMLQSLRSISFNSRQQREQLQNQKQILETWIEAWRRITVQYIKNKKNNTNYNSEAEKLLLQIASSQYFCTALLSIQEWMGQQMIVCCTHSSFQQINSLKQLATQLHSKALQLASQYSEEIKIYSYTSNIITKIIYTLMIIAQQQNIQQSYQCNQLVINLLKILKFYLLCNPRKFQNNWKQLLPTIIFPFLTPSKEELTAFEENPEEYISLFADYSENQQFGLLKTQACQLLQAISDTSYKITQKYFITDFIVNFAVDSIKNNWNKIQNNIYEIQFVGLDVGILILSMFSYRLESHKHKISQLKQILTPSIAYKLNIYERAIIYLFLSYCFTELYPNSQDGKFWVEIALKQMEHKTTKLCSQDFLFNIADSFYSDCFIQQLTNKISTNNQLFIWNAMQKLIITYISKINPIIIISLIEKVYTRFMVELETLSTQKIMKSINTIKLIQIIGRIANSDRYCIVNTNVRDKIWEIVMVYEKVSQLKLYDEIAMILCSLMRQEQFISERSKGMLHVVVGQFAKDEYSVQVYYLILNHYIMKGEFEIIPLILETVKTGIFYHLMNFGENTKQQDRTVYQSYLLLLVQNILWMHGKYLNQQNLNQISSIVINFLTQDTNSIENKVILSRALNTLLLCYIYLPIDSILSYIQAYTQKQIYFNYDISVLLACVQFLIFKEQALEISAQMISIVANAIKIFRKKQKIDSIYNNNNNNNNNINNNNMNINNNNININNNNNNNNINNKINNNNNNNKNNNKKMNEKQKSQFNKYKQYEKILDKMITPFKSDIKFETQLYDLLDKLKQVNVENYKKMIQLLPKNDINTICHLCKFVDEELLQKRIIYKIVKLKIPSSIGEDQQQNNMHSSDEEDQQFKRKRILFKRGKKLKSHFVDCT